MSTRGDRLRKEGTQEQCVACTIAHRLIFRVEAIKEPTRHRMLSLQIVVVYMYEVVAHLEKRTDT